MYMANHTQKQYYFVKLSPPRPSFTQDMTDVERNTMTQHAAYWTDFMQRGAVVVFGPVSDPKGAYGVGVVAVGDEQELKRFLENDPAFGLTTFEYFPMRAIVPGHKLPQ